MAMRRRIKVPVNLTAPKRKIKVEPKSEINEQKFAPITKGNEHERPVGEVIQPMADIHAKERTVCAEKHVLKVEPMPEPPSDDAAFKCPPKVEYHRSNSHSASDDLFHSDIDVMKMDLQKSALNHPMSPSKAQRQRIKPTPIFGQRRNSFVGTPASPASNDDLNEAATPPQRRERHYSGSVSYASPSSHIPIKSGSFGSGRIRTESSCSVFSDSHTSNISKTRKTDEHNAHRLQARRDFEARFCNGVPDKSSLKMFDLIYYNPTTNPMEQKPKIAEIKSESKELGTNVDTDSKSNDAGAVPVPQLKLSSSGELVLDDKSLEIETTAEQEARKVLAKSSLIFLDENTGMNGFYKRQKRTKDWTPDETIRFYRCLQTIGTDFSLMCELFPKRTRRDMKLKFKKEERCNGALVNKALLYPNTLNVQELKDQFEVEDKQREEEEQSVKQVKKAIKKVQIKTSKSARALKNADDLYNLEASLDTNSAPIKRKRYTKSIKKPERTTIKTEAEDCETVIKNEPMSHEQNIIPIETESQQYEDEITELLSVETEKQCESPYDKTFMYDGENSVSSYGEDVMDVNPPLAKNTAVPYVDSTAQPQSLIVSPSVLSSALSFQSNSQYDNINDNTEVICNDTPTFGKTEIITSTETWENPASPIDADETQALDSDTPKLSHPVSGDKITNSSSPSIRANEDIDEEQEILRILEDIANGSLVVVSSFDPETPQDVVNEIFVVDPSTGELYDEPLDIPAEIVQSILSVMT